MARRARIIAPGCPHHVTARGNRREPILFEAGDREIYRDRLGEQMRPARVCVWAYCLMPNQLHLIACPETVDGLGLNRRQRLTIKRRCGTVSDTFLGEPFFCEMMIDA